MKAATRKSWNSCWFQDNHLKQSLFNILKQKNDHHSKSVQVISEISGGDLVYKKRGLRQMYNTKPAALNF